MLHVAQHLRRLAKHDGEVDVDRSLAELVVADHQLAIVARGAEHGKRAALTLANRAEAVQFGRRQSQYIALLRLVAPDLARRHARVLARDAAQLEMRAALRLVRDLRHGVRQPARADVVDREDRVGGAELPAAIDHLLRTALDLRVAALHRIEVEIRRIGAGGHGGRSSTTHADQHAGAAKLDQQRARREDLLVGMRGVDVADSAGQHDRLVVAAQHPAYLRLERAEVAAQVRPAELVVE